MLMNQKHRTIKYLTVILFLFAAGFISWLIIDVTHPDIGWFQREATNQSGAKSTVRELLYGYIKNLFV